MSKGVRLKKKKKGESLFYIKGYLTIIGERWVVVKFVQQSILTVLLMCGVQRVPRVSTVPAASVAVSVRTEGFVFQSRAPVSVRLDSSGPAVISVSLTTNAQQNTCMCLRQQHFNSTLLLPSHPVWCPACPAGRYGPDCGRVAVCGKRARSDLVTGVCVGEEGELLFCEGRCVFSDV